MTEENIPKYSDMKTSVLNYQGFYISRKLGNYSNGEISLSSDTPNGLLRTDAQSIIYNMYKDNDGVVSHLPWGGELDAVYNFVDPTRSNTSSDGTRISPNKNIYDLNTGNWELSQEATDSTWGGDVYRIGKYREQCPINFTAGYFHVALYIRDGE